MTDKIKWLEHKGKKILYVDFTNLHYYRHDEMYATFDNVRDYILNEAGNNLLVLIDSTNSDADLSAVNRLKEDASREKHLIKKEAVIGLSGMKTVFIKSINLFANTGIQPFDTLEKALDWLVK